MGRSLVVVVAVVELGRLAARLKRPTGFIGHNYSVGSCHLSFATTLGRLRGAKDTFEYTVYVWWIHVHCMYVHTSVSLKLT